MPTSKDYRDYIAEQLKGADALLRPMMGEYVLYCGGKVVGGLYDNRLLVKPTPAARARLPGAPEEAPYEGAKPMLLVQETDDKAFLSALLPAVAAEIPEKTKKKRR